LRKRVATNLNQKKNILQSFIVDPNYFANIYKSNYWGDQICLNEIVELFEVEIFIVCSDKNPILLKRKQQSKFRIFIFQINEVHFDYIMVDSENQEFQKLFDSATVVVVDEMSNNSSKNTPPVAPTNVHNQLEVKKTEPFIK